MLLASSRAGLMASLLVLMAPMVSSREGTVRMRFLAFPAVPEVGAIPVGGTGVGDQEKPLFHPHGQAAAIAAKGRIVLLLRKGDTCSDGFIVLSINGELGAFGGARFHFINTSSFKIGACRSVIFTRQGVRLADNPGQAWGVQDKKVSPQGAG
jgi:hypothetical protein